MAAQSELTEFVRGALSRGTGRAEVERVLLEAGWTRDMVDSALAAYAEVDFVIPVPRPRAYLSAREAFLYLLLFSTLYLSAFHAGAVVFEGINRAFPDATDQTYAPYVREAVRWALSWLIVAFPVFAYLTVITNRSVRRDPAKRRSSVRRWLMYMTVFLAASALVADVTTLVYNVLGGELTTRFALKVLTVAAIAGTVFGYYLSDLRLDDTRAARESTLVQRGLAGWGSLSAGSVMLAGLFMVGPPSEERMRRIDDRRVEHLREIVRAENAYLERHGRLSSSLADLEAAGGLFPETETGPYEYRATGTDTYDVCATFERASRPDSLPNPFWVHSNGRQCYALKAKEYK